MPRGPWLVLLAAAGPAWAGPPFITDDPEPVGLGHWEINTAIAGSWGHGSSSFGAPSVDINYGATANVQLHAQPRYSFEHADRSSTRGFDDTEVGVKWRFLDVKHAEAETMVGIYPMYQLATGSRALGSDRGTHGIFLPVWLQHDRGDWTFYGGAGYRINHATDARNSVFVGMTALYKISDSLALGGEVLRESASAIDASASRGFNLGGVLRLSSPLNLLFSAGRTYAGPASMSQAYLALQAHF